MLAVLRTYERVVDSRKQVKLGAACTAEVTDLRMVDAKLVIDVVDELGDEKVQIGVALPVAMRRHVEWHALEPGLEVRSVVEVEPANEVLIRLSIARVLSDDHAWHCLEELALTSD